MSIKMISQWLLHTLVRINLTVIGSHTTVHTYTMNDRICVNYCMALLHVRMVT